MNMLFIIKVKINIGVQLRMVSESSLLTLLKEWAQEPHTLNSCFRISKHQHVSIFGILLRVGVNKETLTSGILWPQIPSAYGRERLDVLRRLEQLKDLESETGDGAAVKKAGPRKEINGGATGNNLNKN